MRRSLTATVLVLVLTLLVCCGGDSDGRCEQVTLGNSDAKIENNLDTGVEADFPDIAFQALIRPGKCEIFGMPAGSREVELTQCTFVADDQCNTFGPTVEIDLPLSEGETITIDVHSGLF
ncbi:MAG: hypothetical protein GY716_07480 [bacterium]|nr:hypothetical protein [bacterium]